MRFLILIFILISSLNLSAQTFDLGSGLQIYNFNGQMWIPEYEQYIPVVSESRTNYTAMFSANIPFKKLNEDLALGVSPNISLGTSGSIMTFDVPLYIALKWGATSTQENMRNIGFGLGLGGMLSGFSTTVAYYEYHTLNGIYFAPSVMAEISGKIDYRTYKLRVDFFSISP